ncbi:hypothetical protein BGZ52_004081, partial [Haplosporangium bisporale]
PSCPSASFGPCRPWLLVQGHFPCKHCFFGVFLGCPTALDYICCSYFCPRSDLIRHAPAIAP